jgi:ABC-2 type transport system permease protein
VIAPASPLWLLAHEMRVGWRRVRARQGGKGRWVRLAFSIGAPLVVTLLIGVPLGVYLRDNPVEMTAEAVAIGALVTAALFTLMLSQTLTLAVDALYQRGDFDLLFSSPIDPRTVMAVRFLAVAFDAFTVFAYFLTGPLIAVAVLARPAWIAAIMVLFALALAATGCGLLLAWALFRAIGPRRTRAVAHVLAALLGAAFFLATQIRNIFGGGAAESLTGAAIRLAHDPRLDVPGFDWPLRAMMGEPLPLAGVLAASAAVFGLANLVLGPRFADDAAAAAGAGVGGGPRVQGLARGFVPGAFAATLRKELRLLGRDPAVITQVLMRVLYMAPLGVLLLRQAGGGQGAMLPGSAAALSLVAGQVAASIAWIAVSAEDAPELLASAPAPVSVVRRGKLAAAALPTAVLLLPILAPLFILAPWVGLMAALGSATSIAALSMINVWWQRPARRSEFRRRGSTWFVTVAELLVGAPIAVATGLFATASVLGIIPAVAAGVIFLALRRSDARIAEALRAAV